MRFYIKMSQQQQIQEFNFRLQCVKHNFKMIFEKLSPPGNSAKELKLLKVDYCCGTCNHTCVICKEDCQNKPSCMKAPCRECGCEANNCQAEKIIKSWIIYDKIVKIQSNEIEDFIVNKVPLKSFPYCKTTNQLLSTYMQDAVKACSMHFLKKNQMTEDDHLDNQMHARMIFRMPAKILRYSFPEVQFDPHNSKEDLKTLAHQAEGVGRETVNIEINLATNIINNNNKITKGTQDCGKDSKRNLGTNLPPQDNPYVLTREDKQKEWTFEELLDLMVDNLAKLKALVRNEPYLKDLLNKDGYTLPFICAEENNFKAMQMFISENMNCNEVIQNTTIFHQAASCGSLETLKMLSHKLDEINKKDSCIGTMLHLACWNNHIEVIEFLLGRNGIDVNIKNIYGNTALHLSCIQSSIKAVAMLLGHQSIDVCIKNKKEKLPDELTNNMEIKRMIKKKCSQK